MGVAPSDPVIDITYTSNGYVTTYRLNRIRRDERGNLRANLAYLIPRAHSFVFRKPSSCGNCDHWKRLNEEFLVINGAPVNVLIGELHQAVQDVYLGYVTRAIRGVSDVAWGVETFSSTALRKHLFYLLWNATGPQDEEEEEEEGGDEEEGGGEEEDQVESGSGSCAMEVDSGEGGGETSVQGGENLSWTRRRFWDGSGAGEESGWDEGGEDFYECLELRVPIGVGERASLAGPRLAQALAFGAMSDGGISNPRELYDVFNSCTGQSGLFEIVDRAGDVVTNQDDPRIRRLRKAMWDATTSRPLFQRWRDPDHPPLVGFWQYVREELGIVEVRFLAWHREVLPLRRDVACGRVRVRIMNIPDSTRRFLSNYRASRAEKRWGQLSLPMQTYIGVTH